MKRIAITGMGSSFATVHLKAAQRAACEPFFPSFAGELAPAVQAALQVSGCLQSGVLRGVDADRAGVVVGSSKGDLRFREQSLSGDGAGDAGLWYRWPDRFAADLALKLGWSGPVLAPVAACATGSHAMALGAQLIQDDRADLIVAGAVENALLPPIMGCYRNLGALSASGTMRPFDRDRDGFVPAEGAGFLLLEAEDIARRRGAKILGYLTGWSLVCDATHMTSMDVSGASIARAIRAALQRAGLPSVAYVNAHGTATEMNDLAESRGIAAALGHEVPVSSTKPLTGHLLGAAGAVEAVIAIQAMQNAYLPPTLNLQNRDERCDLDYIPLNGRSRECMSCLSLNYGFGGHIGALIFEKN